MLKRHAALVLPLLIAASGAAAGTVTESVQFDYDPLQGTTELTLNAFDTQGGARVLRRATFNFQHNFTLDVALESTGPTALQQGDFSLSLAYISIFQLGTVGEGSPPFFGPGGYWFGDLSADLAAYDGVPGNDGPDSARLSLTDAFITNFEFNHTERPVLDALTDTGPLTTIYGGFTELFFYWINDPAWPEPAGGFPSYPDDAALWVALENYRHFGEITITYRYTYVPGPGAGAAALVVLGAGTRRRRRA